MVLIRDYSVKIKAVGKDDGLDDGQFEAIVSVFGNVDSYGDRVVKGAFADDVEAWKSGEPLPIIWSHKWEDPFAHIGIALDAKETDAGLYVKGQNDLDSPFAVQVQRLLKARRVKQFSFAYDVLDGGMVDEEIEADGEKIQRSVYELRKLKTHEVGPCLLGVNQETELISAKAANLAMGVLAGRQLTKPGLRSLKAALDTLREVIVLQSTEDPPAVETPPAETGYPVAVPDEQSQTGEPPVEEDPTGDNSDDKAAPVIARRRLAVETMFL